jgi:ATP-binding cassette subfamily F protein 3
VSAPSSRGNGGSRAKAPAPAAAEAPAPAARAPSKNRAREQQRLEAAVEQAEAALSTLEDELAAPERWASKYESAKSTARHTAARRAVEDAYAALEAFEAAAPA